MGKSSPPAPPRMPPFAGGGVPTVRLLRTTFQSVSNSSPPPFPVLCWARGTRGGVDGTNGCAFGFGAAADDMAVLEEAAHVPPPPRMLEPLLT